ncbi:MAG: GNAT family N-acetyltransferase [Bacteroidia bacterium]|nr:GNAT family N-acetyltransferase [Bacteroidia bacterium]
MNIIYSQATSEQDLRQILDLQQRNLPKNITEDEAVSQGFVTVEHDFDLLKRMNHPHGHVIASTGEGICGYALVMLREWQADIPVLVPMFREIDSTIYQGRPLGEQDYFVMGQVCVDKAFRGKGIFRGLYDEMKTALGAHFPFVITEIDARNTRSIRAHEKVGFETIKTYKTNDGREWLLVLLELNE